MGGAALCSTVKSQDVILPREGVLPVDAKRRATTAPAGQSIKRKLNAVKDDTGGSGREKVTVVKPNAKVVKPKRATSAKPLRLRPDPDEVLQMTTSQPSQSFYFSEGRGHAAFG